MTRATISANLRRARKDRGWTLGQAVLRSGVQKRTIIDYEQARAMPGSINLALLCRAYRVSADAILGIDA
jgi:transcriptional regulator with XRE-family HTH domain